jgi:hypothetical protein
MDHSVSAVKVVVTGPRSVGKSSVSKALSRRLAFTYVSSDVLMDGLLDEYGGLDGAIQDCRQGLIQRVGLHVVKDVLSRHNVVFDLAGGSLNSYGGQSKADDVKDLLDSQDVRVVALLPFEDSERSVEHLLRRERDRDHFEGWADDKLRAKVSSDYTALENVLPEVADDVVYTGTDGVSGVVGRVVQRLE